ncbi:hypothetical protein [Oceanidesulfovibrio marinus]|uniref:Uncharacterized protein n=1 Tax=Oceanidesulfovibrio marinus TaxID=370038 RepID=A0ABX6NIW6_9BACT|nr:hypothetical protein [Oceanidesulfovibrio marinus]QJT09672.1 hypothetical protein E8L03_12335 [Oceanidesulfovibrio marinus]
MEWKPATEAELWNIINESYDRMTPEQRKIWEMIKIPPQKWRQEPYGNKGGGFWVVAIVGSIAIWFNDIEDGFNQSTFSCFGSIDEYSCNQDELELQVQNIINQIRD